MIKEVIKVEVKRLYSIPTNSWIYLTILCLLSSCSYHWGGDSTLADYSSIEIPYIKGDFQGTYTSALAMEIAKNTHLKLKTSHADLVLELEIEDINTENIGFTYQRDANNNLLDKIIANENRLDILVKISLKKASSASYLIKGDYLSIACEYDYDTSNIRTNVTDFSLGQISYLENAEKFANNALERLLAKQVIDYIENF